MKAFIFALVLSSSLAMAQETGNEVRVGEIVNRDGDVIYSVCEEKMEDGGCRYAIQYETSGGKKSTIAHLRNVPKRIGKAIRKMRRDQIHKRLNLADGEMNPGILAQEFWGRDQWADWEAVSPNTYGLWQSEKRKVWKIVLTPFEVFSDVVIQAAAKPVFFVVISSGYGAVESVIFINTVGAVEAVKTLVNGGTVKVSRKNFKALVEVLNQTEFQ